MASTKKSLSARVAAGIGAVAIATLTAFSGALPASASANNIDENANGQIVIHKYEQPVVDGAIGTGHELAQGPDSNPIDNIDFLIQRVNGLDVTATSTWNTLDSLTAEQVTAAGSGYGLTDVGTFRTGVDGAGTVIADVDLGVYLVTELPAPVGSGIVVPAESFLVVVPQADDLTWSETKGWLYEVHVYPKNMVTDAQKGVLAGLAPHMGLGSTITWTLDIGVPIATSGNSLDTFVVTDRLDDRLALGTAADAVRVTVGDDVLASPDDFTFSVENGVLSIDFKNGGMAALAGNRGERVSIQIDTTVQGFVDGSIENTANVVVDGTTIPSSQAVDYWGAVEFLKTDEKGQPLEGAVFQVFDPADTAFASPIAISGVGTEFVSDPNGIVSIAGLRTINGGGQQYVVRELSAPAGYEVGETRQWTVRVPEGATDEHELADVVNEQVDAYMLPITGGSGQAAFMIGGFGLLAGALGFMLMRRRKAKADAQA